MPVSRGKGKNAGSLIGGGNTTCLPGVLTYPEKNQEGALGKNREISAGENRCFAYFCYENHQQKIQPAGTKKNMGHSPQTEKTKKEKRATNSRQKLMSLCKAKKTQKQASRKNVDTRSHEQLRKRITYRKRTRRGKEAAKKKRTDMARPRGKGTTWE